MLQSGDDCGRPEAEQSNAILFLFPIYQARNIHHYGRSDQGYVRCNMLGVVGIMMY